MLSFAGATRTTPSSTYLYPPMARYYAACPLSADGHKGRPCNRVVPLVRRLLTAKKAAPETAEADFLETFLPAGATDEDYAKAIADAMAEVQPAGPKDMGRVIKAARAARFRKSGAVIKRTAPFFSVSPETHSSCCAAAVRPFLSAAVAPRRRVFSSAPRFSFRS